MTWFLIDPGGYRYPVVDNGLSVGRAIDNDVVLDDVEASRHHALIQLRGDEAWVYDRRSANGVYLNEERIREPRRLRPGDRLRFGHSVFRVEYVAPPPIATAEPEPAARPSTSLWQAVLAGAVIGLLGLVIVYFLFLRPLFGAVPTPPAGESDQYAEVLRSIAFVLTPSDDSPAATGGTAVVMSENGRLLTAYGAVVDPTTGRSYNRKGQVLVGINPSGLYTGGSIPAWYLARVVRADRQRGMAVLQIYAQADGSPLPNSFRLTPAQRGDPSRLRPDAAVKVLSFVGGGIKGEQQSVGRVLVLGEGRLLGFAPDPALQEERGWLQTDIGLTLSNIGGLALDAETRLIGLYTGERPGDAPATGSMLRPIDLADILLAGS
ncbi:MAG: FHA domain-containing protein [Caldilineae bacterium]|nr:MAG: FHA domain-containing protein [Caldilineae bacterium]